MTADPFVAQIAQFGTSVPDPVGYEDDYERSGWPEAPMGEASSVISVRTIEAPEIVWEMPASIDRPPMLPFPTKLLGSKLGTLVDAVAAQSQVAADLPAMMALPAITAAIGGRRFIRIRAGWREAPSLWMVTIAGPGERKSAAEDPFSSCLRRWEKKLSEEAIPKIEEAQQEADIAIARLEEAKRVAIKAKPDNLQMAMDDAKLAKEKVSELPPVPSPPRLLYADITPAAMPVKAAEQDGRMAVLHSEGTLIKQMAGLYNSGTPETGFALDAYDGKAMPVDRVGRATIQMETAHLTVGLMLQPVILEQLGRKKDDEMLHNGFVQRFNYAIPPSSLGYQDPRGSIPVAPKLLEDFEHRIGQLLEKLWSSTMTEEIRFSKGADEDMYVFQESLQLRLRRGGDLHSMAGWAAKLPGKLARIAAARTLYEDPDAKVIGSVCFREVLGLAPYFVQHARVCFDLMGANKDAKLTPARDVLDWLRRRKDPEKPFSIRDAQRGVDGSTWQPDGVTADAVKAAVAVLVDRGWVVPKPDDPNEPARRGRPASPQFEVHPLINDPGWKAPEPQNEGA